MKTMWIILMLVVGFSATGQKRYEVVRSLRTMNDTINAVDSGEVELYANRITFETKKEGRQQVMLDPSTFVPYAERMGPETVKVRLRWSDALWVDLDKQTSCSAVVEMMAFGEGVLLLYIKNSEAFDDREQIGLLLVPKEEAEEDDAHQE